MFKVVSLQTLYPLFFLKSPRFAQSITPQLFNLGAILSVMLVVYGMLLLVLTFHLLHILSQRSPSNEVLFILPLTFSCLCVCMRMYTCICTHVMMHRWRSEDQSLLPILFGTVSCWFTTICTRLPGPQASWISCLHLTKECWDYTYI